MAYTVIQTCNINAGGTSTTATVSFASGSTPGNLLVAGWRVTAGSPAITITDSMGNTWTTTASNGVIGIAWAPCTHAGANTLTWNTPSAGFSRVLFVEMSYGSTGVSTWTNTANNQSAIGATTTPNSGTISDLATDLLIGVAANQTDSTSISATGWTQISQLATVDPGLYWKVGTGSDSFSGTSSSASWGIGIANFTPTIVTGGGTKGQQIFC